MSSAFSLLIEGVFFIVIFDILSQQTEGKKTLFTCGKNVSLFASLVLILCFSLPTLLLVSKVNVIQYMANHFKGIAYTDD